MSEDKKQDSPSADEVVDELAEEVGAEDSEEPDEDQQAESDDTDESEDAEATDDSDNSDDDESDDDDGAEDSATDDESGDEESDDDEVSDEPIGPRGTDGSLGRVAGVDELIDPDDTAEAEIDPLIDLSEYSALDDVDEPFLTGKAIAIIALIAVVAGVGLHFYTMDERGSVYHDIALLFQGQYQADMQRRVDIAEAEYVAAQEELIPEFGNLFISGTPREALIYLNDQVQFGETPSGGQWRELRVGPSTVITDLPIQDDHNILITHPGYQDYEITINEDMWTPSGGDYAYQLTVNLTPESEEAHREFHSRMMLGDDRPEEEEYNVEDAEFFGAVNFNTDPAGAQIKINSLYARDEDGEILTTPVELDEYWAYDINVADLYEEGILRSVVGDKDALDAVFDRIETDREAAERRMEEAIEAQEALEAGEIDEEEAEDLPHPDDIREVDTLEELALVDARDLDIDEHQLDEELVELRHHQFPVDRPPRRGDSIQIIYPDDHPEADEMVEYATMLQRAMWHCEFKDDSERARIGDDDPLQEHCNYTYEFDKDFYELNDYIEQRKQERERIEDAREEFIAQLEELDDQFDERLRALGHAIEEVDRITPAEAEQAEESHAEDIE